MRVVQPNRLPAVAYRTAVACTAAGLLALGCEAASEDAAPPVEDVPSLTGRAPPAFNGVPSILLLEPDPPQPHSAPTTTAVMDQFALAFIPSVLVVQAGQPIEFRNSEDVAHNVRVVETATDSMLFNVSTGQGDPYEHAIDRIGGYDVTCDIHPGMEALLLVVSAPYAVVAADDGTFAFSDVPPGEYTISVWHPDSTRRLTRPVALTAEPTEVILQVPQ